MTFEPKDLDPYLSVRHFYGSRLRRLRERADWGLEEAAARLHVSKSTLSRLELAETPPQDGFSEIADRVYETDDWFTELYGLTRLPSHPNPFGRRMELEVRATAVVEYLGMIVPGLLQTETYARALLRAGMRTLSEAELQSHLDFRMNRQKRLRGDNAMEYSVIIDEAAIRRPVGGPVVMREQLAFLIAHTERPNGIIQLLPYETGEHGLLGGTLTLFVLPSGVTFAYEEGMGFGTLVEDPELVQVRQREFDRLRSYSLSPPETAAFIRSVMEALPDDHHA